MQACTASSVGLQAFLAGSMSCRQAEKFCFVALADANGDSKVCDQFAKAYLTICQCQFANAGTLLRKLQGATQLMMLKTCLTKKMALTNLLGMLQPTATLLAAIITGASQKRLEDRLLTGTNGVQGMAMLGRIDMHTLLLCTAVDPGVWRSLFFGTFRC